MPNYDLNRDAAQFPRIRREMRQARERALRALGEGGMCGTCDVERVYVAESDQFECPSCVAEQAEFQAFVSTGRV